MDPQTFTAQNPRFNATLDRARQIQADLIAQGCRRIRESTPISTP